MKLPFRVLDPIFACAAFVELFSWAASSREADPIIQRPAYPKFVTRLVCVVGVSLSLLAAAMICAQWSADSNLNRQHQSAYLHILADLDGLQQKEILDKDALIVSPAYGIPQQWEDPLTLNPPKVKFMLMAWTTSSPAYAATLQQFQVQSLPAGLYQNKNVYLMAQYTLLPAIRQYILEHDGVTVTVKDLYALPVGDLDPYYGQVHLFQLTRQ
jgi:hypothetical protein